MRYFLATYYRKPDGKVDEQIQLAATINDTDIQTCSVILDFENKKIQKAVIQSQTIDTNWTRIVNYYHAIYPDIIEQLKTDNP